MLVKFLTLSVWWIKDYRNRCRGRVMDETPNCIKVLKCLVVPHWLEEVEFTLLHCPSRSARGCHYKWLTFSSIPCVRVVSSVFVPVASVSWLLWPFSWFRSVRACLRVVSRAIVRLRRRRSRLMRENFWRQSRQVFSANSQFSYARPVDIFLRESTLLSRSNFRSFWRCLTRLSN